MMARKRKPTSINWGDALSSARPLLLLTIEFLLRTKKMAPYGNALRLLSVAVDMLIPSQRRDSVVSAIRDTQAQLQDLGGYSPKKSRAILTNLKTLIAQL